MRRTGWAIVIALGIAGPALAQNAATFAGAWRVSTGGMAGDCDVELSGGNGLFGLGASSRMCMGQLAFLNGWRAEANGVSLLGLQGEVIGTLSVNGGVLKGQMADGAVVTLTPASGQTLASGKAGGDCIHNPDHGYCADPGEIAVPTAYPVTVKALHPLAIRTEPTAQSQSLGTIADGQCFIVEGCKETKEGVKCLIPEGTGIPSGWASKHFQQDGTWFVGFQNFC